MKVKTKYEDPLIIVPYNPEWTIFFHLEQSKLSKTLKLPPPQIIHIGSTAISDLKAKDIIDIMIGLEKFAISQDFIDKMEFLGYEYEFTRENWALFNRRSLNSTGFNVHILQKNSLTWNNHLKFKQKLNTDPEIREAYEQLKLHLAIKSKNIMEYSDNKSLFIQKALSNKSK